MNNYYDITVQGDMTATAERRLKQILTNVERNNGFVSNLVKGAT